MQTDGGKWQQKIVIIKSQSLSVSAAVRVLTEKKKKREKQKCGRGVGGAVGLPRRRQAIVFATYKTFQMEIFATASATGCCAGRY